MTLKGIGLATSLAIVTAASGANAEILRLSSFEPPVAHVTKNILTPWAADVNAASGGELDIQIFPGGTLGRNPAQQLKLVEDGVADIAWVIPGYTPGRFNEGTVAELPFLVPSATIGSDAMWDLYEQGVLSGVRRGRSCCRRSVLWMRCLSAGSPAQPWPKRSIAG